MSAATCDRCEGWIEVTNRRFPGFRSQECRDEDRAYRDTVASVQAQRRRDAQQHRRADQARRNPHYLT